MPEPLQFPKNFLWGSATSAHQTEGGNNNDWSRWEGSIKRLKYLKDRGLKSSDFISGKACDGYHRYEEDFNIAKELNQNAHRLSIEWSRIEPEEGKFDENEIQHYINVVKSLCDRGMEPVVTLWHFSSPIWFSDKGGWLNPKAPEYFVRFIHLVVDNLKDYVKIWVTFNEAASIYAGFVYLNGNWLADPAKKRGLLSRVVDYTKARRNFARAHILAYQDIKSIYVSYVSESTSGVMSHNVEVGFTENNAYQPPVNFFIHRIIRRLYVSQRNLYFFKKTFPYYDFIGLNYYHIDRRVPGSYGLVPKQDWFAEEMGWELYSQGLYHCLIDLKRFGKPVYVMENGIPDAKDDQRERFIKEHLGWLHRAVSDGVEVKGYFYWSLLDNFEWAKGFFPRFGLVEVDYRTFERKIRPSAREYAKICRDNVL